MLFRYCSLHFTSMIQASVSRSHTHGAWGYLRSNKRTNFELLWCHSGASSFPTMIILFVLHLSPNFSINWQVYVSHPRHKGGNRKRSAVLGSSTGSLMDKRTGNVGLKMINSCPSCCFTQKSWSRMALIWWKSDLCKRFKKIIPVYPGYFVIAFLEHLHRVRSPDMMISSNSSPCPL